MLSRQPIAFEIAALRTSHEKRDHPLQHPEWNEPLSEPLGPPEDKDFQHPHYHHLYYRSLHSPDCQWACGPVGSGPSVTHRPRPRGE